jgi:hypothetical protein
MGVWFVILWRLFTARAEEGTRPSRRTRSEETKFPWGEVFKVLWDLKWMFVGVVALVGGLLALHVYWDAVGLPNRETSLQTDLKIFGFLLLIFWVYFSWSLAEAQTRIDNLEREVDRLKSEGRKVQPVYHSRESIASTAEFMAQREARLKTERLAAERTERNREVKRRAKMRKANATARHEAEQKKVLLRAVVESLEQEQIWRNQKASGHGWPVHPNDMDWLDEAERKTMLEVWSARGPFRQEWVNPSA